MKRASLNALEKDLTGICQAHNELRRDWIYKSAEVMDERLRILERRVREARSNLLFAEHQEKLFEVDTNSSP